MRKIAYLIAALGATAQAQAAPCLDGSATTPIVYLAADGSGGLNVLSGPTVTLPDGSRTPYSSLPLWPADRLAAVGIYAVTTPTPPSGQSLTQVCYALADGAVTATPTYAAIPAPTVITGSAFWARFSSAEQAAVAQAAQSNATVMTWLITALAAQSIDLANPLTAQGMAVIGPAPGAGLLTQAQIDNILSPSFTTPQ